MVAAVGSVAVLVLAHGTTGTIAAPGARRAVGRDVRLRETEPHLDADGLRAKQPGDQEWPRSVTNQLRPLPICRSKARFRSRMIA